MPLISSGRRSAVTIKRTTSVTEIAFGIMNFKVSKTAPITSNKA